MRFLILGRSVGLKERNLKKKNHKKSWNSWPWYPRTTLKVNIHIFGWTKCTIYCEKCSCSCFCFSLCCYYAHFQIKRIIFWKIMPKMWVGQTTVNGEKKKRMALSFYLFSSVGRALVCRAGGRGFKPRPDQHSGSLNNWEESAAFVMTSTNGKTF